MTLDPALFSIDSALDIRCPDCRYSPVGSPLLWRPRLHDQSGHRLRRDLEYSPIETRDDVLDCFEVAGAGEGRIMCPRCCCTFEISMDPTPHQQVLF